jgi:glycosyltransferase involved in cell wall biosynthesis
VFPLAALRNWDDYDIYHGHVYTSGLLASYLARRNGAKAVSTIHGSYYPIWNEIEGYLKARFYKNTERMLAPLLARMSDLQIHTASYSARKVMEWGAPREKIRVIYNGYSPEVFHPKRSRKGFGGDDLPIVFTARRLVRKNGVEYLVRAFEKILRERNSLLLIAGDGPERGRLERLSIRLGISEHVVFLGLLPHSDVPSYMSIADVVVLPSLIEASSLFALEALAMGKPLVATRVGGLPEIADGALFVKPRDDAALAEGIFQVLDNGFRQKYNVEKHTWTEVARRTEDAYLSLFSQ